MEQEIEVMPLAPLNRHWTVLRSLGILILASMACSPLFGGIRPTEIEHMDFEQVETEAALTVTAIYSEIVQTQTVQANLGESVAAPTMEAVQPALTPTQTYQPILPGPTMADVDVSFSFDESLFSQVENFHEPAHRPANVDSSIHYPDYLLFVFTYADGLDDWGYYGIRVWPVEQYAAMNSSAASAITDLQTLLNTRPAVELNTDFSSLPLPMAAPWMSTKADYLEFQNGTGVRYLEVRVQQAYPISNNSLRYRFQGLTDDGLYYVSATFIASHPALPEDGDQYFEERGIDWDTFQQSDTSGYRLETAQMLDTQPPASFEPSLLLLDDLIASLLIE